MGIEFEKLKKNNFPTDRLLPEKQGRVRGNKNIFKDGLIGVEKQSACPQRLHLLGKMCR